MVFSLWWSFWECKPACSCIFLEPPVTSDTPQHGSRKFRYGVTLSSISSQFSLACTSWFNVVVHCVTPMKLLRAGKGQGDCLGWLQHLQKNCLWALKTRKPVFLMVYTVSPDLVWIFWCAVGGVLQHVPSFCVSVGLTTPHCNVFLCRGYRSKSLYASTLPEESERKREES